METKSKTKSERKAMYAFCVLSATYFIGRCVVSWIFNI
jgi:hypothetical protein